MRDYLKDFTRSAFDDFNLHNVANGAFYSLINCNRDALDVLSNYLARRGFIVTTNLPQLTLTARPAASRAEFPESIVFTLTGSGPLHYNNVARVTVTSPWCVGYFMDEDGMKEMAERKEADRVERAGEAASDRSEPEDNVLRD